MPDDIEVITYAFRPADDAWNSSAARPPRTAGFFELLIAHPPVRKLKGRNEEGVSITDTTVSLDNS